MRPVKMELKKCTSCGEEKPLTIEFFKPIGSYSSAFRAQCKICISKKDIVYQKANAGKRKKQYEENKVELSRKGKEYYQKNKGYIKAKVKKYALENRDEVLRKKRIYTKENYSPEKRKVRHDADKDKQNTLCRQHYINNKSTYIAREANRRATKLKATPAWANHGYIRLFYEGAKIEEKRTGRKVHVDHIYPLQGKLVCGLHCEDNLQLLFAEDNLSKSNKFEVEV